MKDPTRLVDLSSNPRVVALLQAGADDQPSERALQRTLRAAAVGGSIAASSLAAAASTQTGGAGLGLSGSAASVGGAAASGAVATSAASAGLGAGGALAAGANAGVVAQAAGASVGAKLAGVAGLMKWVGVGVVGAASVTYAPEAAHWVRSLPVAEQVSSVALAPASEVRRSQPRAANAGVVIQPSRADEAPADVHSEPAAAKETELRVAPAAPNAAADVAGSSLNNSVRSSLGNERGTPRDSAQRAAGQSEVDSAKTPVSDNFTAEVQLVETSRSAIRNGDAARGLALLEAYETQYPRRQFQPEVLVLRLEALQQLGRSDAARAVARKILQQGATGAHAERARTILGK